MIQYDFRFNTTLIKSFIGKRLNRYKHAEFMYTNSVTGILGIEIDSQVFALTNEYEAFDFLSLDNEATVFRISKSNWDKINTLINNDIIETNINEKIDKIQLINDHTTLRIKQNIEYDMWETKAMIFFMKNHEICFLKQDCWFSQEIEIYKGYDLINKVGDGKGIKEDFNDDDTKLVTVERSIVEII